MSLDLSRKNLLLELNLASNFVTNPPRAITGGYDAPQDDYVHKLWKWRQQCPNIDKPGHGSFCERCDTPWRYPTEGGALWAGRTDYVTHPQRAGSDSVAKGPRVMSKLIDSGSILNLKGKKRPIPNGDHANHDNKTQIIPALWEQLDPNNQRVPLAPKFRSRKIEELLELSFQEGKPMSDTDATRELFRELLGMTNGGTAGGRGSMHIPADIMDSMAGDQAQDALARQNLIMEMEAREGRLHDPRFVSLDLMEMEATDVDSFLSKARKKIIKRSKSTRKGCCMKIGGVLDQMMGQAGGEFLDHVQADDRGKHDPIGDANDAKTYRMVKEDRDELLNFIAEEFDHWEHDHDCALADPKHSLYTSGPLGEQSRYFAAPRRPGLVRDALQEAEAVTPDKAKKVLAMLREKPDKSPKEKALMGKLQTFVSLANKAKSQGQEQQEEDYDMNPSNTANALASFMEAKNSVDRYKAADAGDGKGSPGSLDYGHAVGQHKLHTRDDNAEYPTELMPAKGGGNKTAGEPQSLSTRGKDRGDPIGEAFNPEFAFRKGESREDWRKRTAHLRKGAKPVAESEQFYVSETANALANFMEASHNCNARMSKLKSKGVAGADGKLETRSDTRERLGGPLENAEKVRKQAAAKGQAGEGPRWDGNDPIGDAGKQR